MLSHGKLLAGVILIVSIVSMLEVQSLATQSRASPTNIAAIDEANAPVSNATLVATSTSAEGVCYSSQCQVVPFSAYYGVTKVVLDLSSLSGLTFTIYINSTLGPAYVEQLQLAFYNDNYNSPPVVSSYWTLNGGPGFAGISNGAASCSTVTSLYVGLVAACGLQPTLPGFMVLDPMGNPSIPVGPGNHNAPSAGIHVSIASSGQQLGNYPITIIATVVAPVGANVTISM